MTSAARQPAAEHLAPATPPGTRHRGRRLPTALEVALGRPAASARSAGRYDAAIANLPPEELAAVLQAASTAGHGEPGRYPPPGDLTAAEDARRT